MIGEFKGRYYFLSNFYNSDVTYNGITYRNNEAAFQAQKTVDENLRILFSCYNPSEAKAAGRRATLRSDWEVVKEQIMYEICKAKFEQNPDLKKKLLDTGDELLEEGNTWHDNEWGVCGCIECQDIRGRNKLGKILMRVRTELRNNEKI